MGQKMTKANETKILEAIREAVEAAVVEFGIEGVRALSMFPSASKAQEELPKAA